MSGDRQNLFYVEVDDKMKVSEGESGRKMDMKVG